MTSSSSLFVLLTTNTVDRILNQQKAEREAKRREAEKEAEKKTAQRQLQLQEQAKGRNAAVSSSPAPPRSSITNEPTPTSEEKKPTIPQAGGLTRPPRPPSIADNPSGTNANKDKSELGT
jgi:hypothetical protein